MCFHLCPQQYNALNRALLQTRCVHEATVCDGAGSPENTGGASLDAVRPHCDQVRCKMGLVGATASPETLTDLELLAELRGVALGIHPQQLLVGDGKLVHQNGRLSAEAGLQDGVVDEDVLLLEGHAVASGHVHAEQTAV